MISLRKGMLAGNLILLALVCYALGSLAMDVLESRLRSGAGVAVVRRQRAAPPKARRRVARSEFQTVLDANMFKAERTQKQAPKANGGRPAPGAPAVADEDPLGLTLTGTMIFGQRSFAIVSAKGAGGEKMYRMGDCLPAREEPPSSGCQSNQGKLVAVQSKQIQVVFQGRKHTVLLTEKVSKPAAGAAARRARRTSAKKVRRPRSTAAAGGGAFPSTREGNSINMRVPGVEVSKAFENFSTVLKQARVVPYSGKDGAGFQIRSIRPGSIFQRIGLRNFDVIKTVNGTSLTTADQAMGLLTAFRNEKEITLDVRRRNEDLKLNYTIE